VLLASTGRRCGAARDEKHPTKTCGQIRSATKSRHGADLGAVVEAALVPASAALLERLSWIRGTLTPLGDERCVLELTADSVDSIAIALVFLGVEFEVQEPSALRVALQAIAKRIERAIKRSPTRARQSE
jgi:WYL domain